MRRVGEFAPCENDLLNAILLEPDQYQEPYRWSKGVTAWGIRRAFYFAVCYFLTFAFYDFNLE
jgi:hypothetical protein